MSRTIQLNVNDVPYELSVAPNQTLLDVLRDELALTGTKKGCDSGVCGACTVLLDGEPVLACLTLAIRCDRSNITTIEGLAPAGKLHPLQEAAVKHNAVQCGYCTPGWILAAKALLDKNPQPTRADVQRAVAGNLCRCTGYKRIEDAVMDAADSDISFGK